VHHSVCTFSYSRPAACNSLADYLQRLTVRLQNDCVMFAGLLCKFIVILSYVGIYVWNGCRHKAKLVISCSPDGATILPSFLPACQSLNVNCTVVSEAVRVNEVFKL